MGLARTLRSLNHLTIAVLWLLLYFGFWAGFDELYILGAHAAVPLTASLAQRPASARHAFLRGPLPWLALYASGWIYALVYETGRWKPFMLFFYALLIIGFALYSAIVCSLWERIARRVR